MRRHTLSLLSAVAGLSLLGTAVAPAATAAPAEEVGNLITPLSLAVAPDGTVYVSQNFAGILTKAVPGQDPVALYTAPQGNEVGAVSLAGDTVTFATTFMGPDAAAKVWSIPTAGGEPTAVANVWRYERRHNPDGDTRYGIVGLSKSCTGKFDRHDRHWLPYSGVEESHPYASTSVGGSTFVADAAANAVLEITDAGVSTEAVLPPTKVEISRKIRRALEIPRCADGSTIKLEPVPTDVEVGPDGNLYVTSLPGGPEIPQMGANGRVYRIDAASGKVSKVADQLLSPVGLAIAPDGTAYVSMLFAGTIVEQPLGSDPGVFAEVPFPGDVEYVDGKVYGTVTDLTNDGSTPPAGQVLSWDTAVPR